MANLNKYLSAQEIVDLIGIIVIDPSFELMSQDSYNENKVAAAILATKRVPELCLAAINMAIIGFGNRKYGNFRLRDNVVEISHLLTQCNVKLNLNKDAKLKEEDLTPGRLCRFFRNNIRTYITDTNTPSYMYRKYSTREAQFVSVLFRGSEYLDDLTDEEVTYILETYARMDANQGINISQRIRRVFEAKRYVLPGGQI